jgi:hypothetical protein
VFLAKNVSHRELCTQLTTHPNWRVSCKCIFYDVLFEKGAEVDARFHGISIASTPEAWSFWMERGALEQAGI